MKKALAILLAGILAFGLFACDNGGSTQTDPPVTQPPATDAPDVDPTEPSAEVKDYKIGVSVMELTAYTWYQGVIDGCHQWMEDNGAKNGVNFKFTFEDSRSDVQTMLDNVESLISAGSDGIILFPADASSAIPTMKMYVAEGIPFVTGDFKQDPPSPDDVVWATHVGHDMRALGVKSAEVAIEYLKTLDKDDPVCLFVSRPTSGQVSVDRYEGFSDTILAAFPNATVIEEGDAGAGNRDSAQTLTENVLQREAVVDVVSGHNDAAVVGAYNAAVAQGRNEIKFVGIAGDIDVLGWIADGNEAWLGEVLQDPMVLGYQTTDAMYRTLVLGEELPADYELPPPDAITPDNISEFDWQNWGWLG